MCIRDSTNPDNFVSLLYYFGMLTISGMYEGKTKLTIPNQVVREQIYTYLLSTYNEAELNFSSYEKNELASTLAYDGDWKAYFGYIADCLKRYTSQRDKQKGELFVHGFTLAMTAQNRFYRPISEADTQSGYVDIFLSPTVAPPSDKRCGCSRRGSRLHQGWQDFYIRKRKAFRRYTYRSMKAVCCAER